MKRFALCLILLLSCCFVANAQSGTSGRIRYGSVLPTTCSPMTGDVFFLTTGTNGLYQCLVINVWTRVAIGGNSGTVNSSTANSIAYYAANGNTVSGLSPVANSVLAANVSSVPSFTSTLPTSVQGNITTVGTISSGQLKVDNGTQSTFTVPYNSSVTIPTWVGTVLPTETYGAGQTITTDQSYIAGTGSVNNSTLVTINSGHSFTNADVGLTFSIFTTTLFNAPFCNATIASVTDATDIVITPSCSLNLSAQPWALFTPLSNIYSVVVGNGASTATTGATVLGAGAIANSSSYFLNNGGQFTVHGQYGGPPTIIGALASGIGVAIGAYSQSTNIESVAIGPASTAKCLACFSLGDRAQAESTGPNGNEIAIGDALSATGNGNIHMGGGGTAAQNASIILGQCNGVGNPPGTSPCDFADNQMLIGGAPNGSTTAFTIKDIWVGNGDGVTNRAWSNTTPVDLTIHATGGSGSNIKAGNEYLAGGISTGNAVAGYVGMQTGALLTASGSTAQTLVNRAIVGAAKVLANNTATTVVNVTDASNTSAAGIVEYAVEVFDGTDVQTQVGAFEYTVQNKGGVFSNNSITSISSVNKTTTGTLSVTWTISAANPALLQINANSSLTPATGYPRVTYSIKNYTNQNVTIQ